jgi:hypothetical protein
MSKRLLSAGLWSFAALYAGSILHGVSGTPALLGPVVGLLTGALIVSDPIGRLKTARAATRVAHHAPVPGLSIDLA